MFAFGLFTQVSDSGTQGPLVFKCEKLFKCKLLSFFSTKSISVFQILACCVFKFCQFDKISKRTAYLRIGRYGFSGSTDLPHNYEIESKLEIHAVFYDFVLQIVDLPSNPVLTGKVNDNPRDAPAASPVLVNVTDVIKLTCAGDIGSDIGAYWDWMKTSDSSVDTMMKFLPLSHSNANEKITDVDGPCTNSRTTVLTYHITETDKNQGDLAFMCSANSTVPLPGGETVYVSSSTFYIHVRKYLLFSSPEPKAPGELIVQAGSVVRPSTISNDFSSETTGLIATKFHIQPPGPLGKKSCSNDLGQMTNMAAMPIYGKNLKKLLLQNR